MERISTLTDTMRKKLSYFKQNDFYDPRYELNLILAKNQLAKYIEKIRLKFSDRDIPEQALKNIQDLTDVLKVMKYQENYILELCKQNEELKAELVKEKIYSTKIERELNIEKESIKKMLREDETQTDK